MPRQKRIAKGNIVYHALKRAKGRLIQIDIDDTSGGGYNSGDTHHTE